MRKTKRNKIRKMLEYLSPAQVAIFNSMYGSVDRIRAKDMDWAIVQITNTIGKKAMFYNEILEDENDN